MHIWTRIDWEKKLDSSGRRRSGLRFRYEKGVNNELRNELMCFANWLRYEYFFPLRVVVYIKAKKTIRAVAGDEVVGTFFEPYSYSVEPFIKIATGDYEELKAERGRNDAVAELLLTVAHELTHYFQWINGIELTPMGTERQATNYSRYIVYEYYEAINRL